MANMDLLVTKKPRDILKGAMDSLRGNILIHFRRHGSTFRIRLEYEGFALKFEKYVQPVLRTLAYASWGIRIHECYQRFSQRKRMVPFFLKVHVDSTNK